MNVVQRDSGITIQSNVRVVESCGEVPAAAPPPALHVQAPRFGSLLVADKVDFVVCLTMSSLHSCRWDWCRFTTVLHDDFVEHVISTHIDKAEPVKRADISLIRQVEQGASGHSGESTFQPSCGSYLIVIDSFMGGISNVTVEATGARSEAPQLSFTSSSTFLLPLSQQKQHATSSDGSLAGVGHHSSFIHLLHGITALLGPESGYITVQPTNTGTIQIPKL
jgi:hypothetical protein